MQRLFKTSPIILLTALIIIVAFAGVGFGSKHGEYKPPSVDSLDVPKLGYTVTADGVKEFRLTAEPVKKSFYPGFNNGLPITLWGFNGSMPGPTIEVTEGDRVRIIVRNNLPEPTSIHWHGIDLPNNMDGVGGHTQAPIPTGGEFVYEFTLKQNGTYMYHSGYNQTHQVGMGAVGMFIVHPKKPFYPIAHREFTMMLQMFTVSPGYDRPDTMSMEEQYFTINGLSAPRTKHLKVRVGEHVRIRIANLSLMAHPIHMHGHRFMVTGTDGGRIPDTAQWKAATIIVGPGETRDIEFTAVEPGIWMFHCHILHHIMNDMSKPTVPGHGGHQMAEAEGMHTIVEVLP